MRCNGWRNATSAIRKLGAGVRAHEARHDHQVLGQTRLHVVAVETSPKPPRGGISRWNRRPRQSPSPSLVLNTHSALRGVYDSPIRIRSSSSPPASRGNPLSRHYDDLGELWRRGELHPRCRFDPDLSAGGSYIGDYPDANPVSSGIFPAPASGRSLAPLAQLDPPCLFSTDSPAAWVDGPGEKSIAVLRCLGLGKTRFRLCWRRGGRLSIQLTPSTTPRHRLHGRAYQRQSQAAGECRCPLLADLLKSDSIYFGSNKSAQCKPRRRCLPPTWANPASGAGAA